MLTKTVDIPPAGRMSHFLTNWQKLTGYEMEGEGCARPPITGIPFINLPNSRLPNQQNEKRRHRQKC